MSVGVKKSQPFTLMDKFSLSLLCVGGRGQSILSGRGGAGGGGVWSRKSGTNKKGGYLAVYSFYNILYISRLKKCAK